MLSYHQLTSFIFTENKLLSATRVKTENHKMTDHHLQQFIQMETEKQKLQVSAL